MLWFTSLVSRGDNLPELYRALTQVGAVKVMKKEMARGGKSRVALLHRTFLDDNQRQRWAQTRFKA